MSLSKRERERLMKFCTTPIDLDEIDSPPHGEEQAIVDHAERSVYDDEPDPDGIEDYIDGDYDDEDYIDRGRD